MALTAGTARTGRFELRPISPADPLVLALAILGGLALIIVTTPLGSGDYGQWLMTARPYTGLSIPDYRAAGAVPPVVPVLLGVTVSLVGDALVGLRLFAAVLLMALGASAFAAGATLFRSRRAGLLATVVALLVVDQFLDLFAFGGLLQAAAIVLAWLAVAAFVRASQVEGPAWAWWTLGAACVGLTALTHMGTAYILVPTGCAVAILAVHQAESSRGARLSRLAPLAAVLLAAMAFWLLVLLPGSTDLIRNPASLDYRGPDRLLESLVGHWPTALVAGGGLAAILVGSLGELRRHRLGPWAVLAAWTAITLGVLAAAVVTSAATDYPRFATPILAPLVLAAAAALSLAVGRADGRLVERTGRGTARGWSVVAVVAIILASAPVAADRFSTEATGYRLRAAESLGAAATWIDAHLALDTTVLAPVREAKWLEGLTGRASLFSNAVRYSFRPEEWQRSLAADALLRSNGAIVNPFFVARLTEASADQGAARGLVIAANHGGEYVDLLTTVPGRARILGADRSQPILATLTNLAPTGRDVVMTADDIHVTSRWTGERQAVPVVLRQTISLRADSSVVDLRLAAETTLPVEGLQFELRPATGMRSTAVDVQGREATISFTRIGPGEPQLRIVMVDGDGFLRRTATGGIRIRATGPDVRLLITDLTAAGAVSDTLQWLDPAELLDRYGVGAVLLARDPSLAVRQARMEALGFSLARDFGPYLILVR